MKYDVCVFGGCSLDRMFYQKEDGTYSDMPDIEVPGGKGSNQAVAVSRAGAKTTIITKIGKDKIGHVITKNLQDNNIDISNINIVSNLLNDYSNIYIKLDDRDNEIQSVNGAIDSFTQDLIDKYADVLLNSKFIMCQLKVPKEVTERLIEFCNTHKKFLVLTPCRPEKLSIANDEKNLDLINKISLITCNKREFKTYRDSDEYFDYLVKQAESYSPNDRIFGPKEYNKENKTENYDTISSLDDAKDILNGEKIDII